MALPYRKEIEREDVDVWAATSSQTRRGWPVYLAVTLGLIVAGFLAGVFGSINFPLGFGVNFFWTGIAVQQVGAIWFGFWGVLAGVIFPIFSNIVSGLPSIAADNVDITALYVSLAYIPANFAQGFLPAWAFRHYKADPRLRSGRDYLILFVAMIISSAFGALWSALVVLRSFGLLETQSLPLYVWGWFGGNVVAGLVFNFVLMQAFSALVIRTNWLVKRWFA